MTIKPPTGSPAKPPERAAIFIDGNNWYHFMSDVGVAGSDTLCYKKISEKLVGPRTWVYTKYYIGILDQARHPGNYAAQRAFLTRLGNDDPRITVRPGRIEQRERDNPAEKALREFMNNPDTEMPEKTRKKANQVLDYYKRVPYDIEKAVDVKLAMEMVMGASNEEFDTAYLLSADGDFTPVVEHLRKLNKKVFCASPGYSSQLAQVATNFIPLKKEWFKDVYR